MVGFTLRGRLVRGSQRGKVLWQIAGMANSAHRPDMSGEVAITANVAASFFSTYV